MALDRSREQLARSLAGLSYLTGNVAEIEEVRLHVQAIVIPAQWARVRLLMDPMTLVQSSAFYRFLLVGLGPDTAEAFALRTPEHLVDLAIEQFGRAAANAMQPV